MTFTDEIREEADRMWRPILDHPMVRELGQGTPRRSAVSVLGPAGLRLPDRVQPAIRTRRLEGVHARPHGGTFADLLESTVTVEMDLHRSYAEEFGIGEAELEATTPSPTTRAYTDFLVRTAALGTFGDTVAALLPCMWGFNETGTRLAASGESDDERYATWIDMYSGEEFTELTDWCKGLMNDVATNATESDRERYRELFVTSARYEYRFWDAAWRQEAWEV